MAKRPIQPQDKYVLRLPDGMRDRIKKSAERSGRSMNAEIITALETYFPPEPSIEQLLDRVHDAIEQARSAKAFPYRELLIRALDELSEQISAGIEFDQYRQRLPPKGMENFEGVGDRLRRWKRVQEYGVDQADLERELDRGLLKNVNGPDANAALALFKAGKPDRALKSLRLGEVKFANPSAAHAAIESWLRAFYEDNWGDPDEPWDYDD